MGAPVDRCLYSFAGQQLSEIYWRALSAKLTGSEFRQGVEQTGATFRSLPPAFEKFASLDTRFGLFALGEFMAEATMTSFPVLKAALEADRPDYVMHDSMSTFGKLVAQMLHRTGRAIRPVWAQARQLVSRHRDS